MSENALNNVVKDIHDIDLRNGGNGFLDSESGKIATAHGMRAVFKDWATEINHAADEVSELALSHIDTSSTREAYCSSPHLNRTPW
jgi:hypothetical protein